jgi:hypothetical protein
MRNMEMRNNTIAFMQRYGGNPDSLRNQTAAYLRDHLGQECTFAEIARYAKTTSQLGPGQAEPCSESHVARAVRHVRYRVEDKQKMPFRVIVTLTGAKIVPV